MIGQSEKLKLLAWGEKGLRISIDILRTRENNNNNRTPEHHPRSYDITLELGG